MKPFKFFIAGSSILLSFLFLETLFPGTHRITAYFSLKIPSLSVKHHADNQYKDISKIIKITFAHLSQDSLSKNTVNTIEKQTGQSLKNNHIPGLNTDSIRNVIRLLEFPEGNDTILFPAFASLLKIRNTHQLIRILHYGDSQIEGDRITSYLRSQLQYHFGGCGIGMFPVVASSPGSIPYAINTSGNWKKFTTLVPLANSSGKFGALLSYAQIQEGSGIFDKTKEREAWINLSHAIVSDPAAQHFDQCRIFYFNNKSSLTVEIKQNDQVLDNKTIPPSGKLKALQWNFPQSSKNIKISFKTKDSPDIYGIAMDGKSGVAVDNIPLRGSSGLEFSKTDLSFLQECYKQLNVKLLILQFGVNMVPYVKDNFDYYEKSFSHQLHLLKLYFPHLPVIVIGVSDVSQNGENGYETCPNVENIRDIQKKATFEAGYAFWDIYEAMGGKNSMPGWVFATPALAQKDFVHFNPTGAKLIGEMFYSAFMKEYNEYCEFVREATP